jgi:hypothetical protein
MTTATQPKPNSVPAILVYGTPSGPAMTQASWFRAEDKEAVKAAAKELKFSVIELQTDADRTLAAGAHEGVLKGSGRMIVGSVSPEVYHRIEEHVRKAAGAPDPSKPEIAAATTTKSMSEQNTNNSAAGASSPAPSHATPAAPAITKPDSASREKPCGSARGCWPPIGTRTKNSRASGSPPSSASKPANTSSSGSTPRDIWRSRAGPRISPCRIPSSASRASDGAEKSILRKLNGAA